MCYTLRRAEILIKAIFPKHNIESVHLEANCEYKEEVGKLRPIIHSEAHGEESIGQGEVEGGFDVVVSSNRAISASPHEDAVDNNDENLKDEDVKAHIAVIIRI